MTASISTGRACVPIEPLGDDIPWLTDSYFLRTKDIVGRYGDQTVTYAVFLRRPVISTPRLAIEWLEKVAAERGVKLPMINMFA